MLVLSRRLNEMIVIGKDIEIRVVQIKGQSIRLGIKAPLSTRVHRKEVWESIHDQECAQSDRSQATPAVGDDGQLSPSLTEGANGGPPRRRDTLTFRFSSWATTTACMAPWPDAWPR